MIHALRRASAWIAYRLIRAFWWVRRPVVLGVRILITDGNRVLLVRHSYRDAWFLPGGRPKSGELLARTARREVKEETGIALDSPKLLGVYSSLEGPESNHVVVFVSSIHGDVRSRTVPGTEIDRACWVPVDALPEDAAEQTRQIIHDWQRGQKSVYRVVE